MLSTFDVGARSERAGATQTKMRGKLSDKEMTVEEWIELGRENSAIQKAATAISAFHNYVNKIRAGVSRVKMEPINVMIVDDHDTVRRGLAVFLRAFDYLQLVGEAANGLEAVNLCAELHPHVTGEENSHRPQ
jgi:PleD family two-component response regulator